MDEEKERRKIIPYSDLLFDRKIERDYLINLVDRLLSWLNCCRKGTDLMVYYYH